MSRCNSDSDIHLDNNLVKDLNADTAFVKERLYVIDEYGQLHIGCNAFIAIWRHSPNEIWTARVSSLPVINQCLNGLYNLVAKGLYHGDRWQRHG